MLIKKQTTQTDDTRIQNLRLILFRLPCVDMLMNHKVRDYYSHIRVAQSVALESQLDASLKPYIAFANMATAMLSFFNSHVGGVARDDTTHVPKAPYACDG